MFSDFPIILKKVREVGGIEIRIEVRIDGDFFCRSYWYFYDLLAASWIIFEEIGFKDFSFTWTS